MQDSLAKSEKSGVLGQLEDLEEKHSVVKTRESKQSTLKRIKIL